MTNCKNCGAVLHGNKCDYCKSEYGHDKNSKKSDFYSDPSMMILCEPKPKMNQEQYDRLLNEFQQYMISRGGLYGSVIRQAFYEVLARHDTSSVIMGELGG